jgi:hypothetical protein
MKAHESAVPVVAARIGFAGKQYDKNDTGGGAKQHAR